MDRGGRLSLHPNPRPVAPTHCELAQVGAHSVRPRLLTKSVPGLFHLETIHGAERGCVPFMPWAKYHAANTYLRECPRIGRSVYKLLIYHYYLENSPFPRPCREVMFPVAVEEEKNELG